MTPGNKVAALGEHFRLTQERWAAILGINRNTLASYKNRKNANPSTERIREWGDRFGIPFGWFFDGSEDPPVVERDHVAAERSADLVARKFANWKAYDEESPAEKIKSYEAMISGRKEKFQALVAAGKEDTDEARELSREIQLMHRFMEDMRLTADAESIKAVHPDDLTNEEADFADPETVEIPLWQGVMTGLDETHFIEEKRPRKIHVPKFFFSRKKPERFICAIPKGKSMAPRIVNPDRVITLLGPEAPPNSLVVARSSDGINFIKVLRLDRMGNMELHSINPDFPPITRLEDWTLKAAVVGIWKPYEQNGPNIEFNGGQPLRG